MMTLTPSGLAIAGAIMAAWLVLSAWALVSGLRMRGLAAQARGQSRRLAEMLDGAPALPMLVRSDGRVEASERLARWLGLDRAPDFLSELLGEDGVLETGDADRLAAEVKAAQRSGKAFSLPIRAAGSSRMLMVKGGPAPEGTATHGAVVLWIFDLTETQGQIAALGKQVETYRHALEALSGLIEAAPMPIWHRTADGRLGLVNSAYVKAVDAGTAEQVVEQGVELVEAVDGLSPAEAATRASQGGEPAARMVPVTVEGERRMMRVVDVPLGPAGVGGYAIDMHELEVSRAELRHLVQANRDMLDRLSAGVAQFGADHKLQFCNQPFLSIFGLKPEVVAVDTDFDRVLDAMSDAGLVPETRDFPAWRKERRQWFLSPNAQEELWLLGDGVHLRVYAQPLPDGGLLLIFEDRTEHVQLSSARDTLLRVRAATFDNLFEAVAVFASDGRLHLWNKRFRQVWSVEEDVLASHPRVDDLMSGLADRLGRPQQASVIHQLVRAATVERRQREGHIAFADGRHFQFAAIPLPDGNALFVMLDVSDSKKIEQALRDRNEALEDADRVKTAFVSNMSYELRTPLTSIGGFAEMMQSGLAGPLPETSREYVEAIVTSTDRLAKLIDNLLDLTQGAAGALPIERKPVDLAALVRDVAAQFGSAAQEKQVTIALALQPHLGTVAGDARRIRQALEHLVDNAVRYVSAGGRVLIHGDGTQKGARIVVSDDGPGMDSKLQARLFDSFARFSHGPDGEPHGIGLPLVRRLVEAHGGQLQLVSEPGQGTMVTIELPRKP